MYLLKKKLFFLVNLTSAVYISSSDCNLDFTAKSEGSLACPSFVGHRRGWSLIRKQDIHLRVDPMVVSPADAIRTIVT
jgi:hypothetical protein